MSFVRVFAVVCGVVAAPSGVRAGGWGPPVSPSAAPAATADALYFKADPKPATPAWSDPWKDYGPEVAHAVAFECSANDRVCITEHDTRVLSLAIMSSSPGTCERASRPEVCTNAYLLTVGDVAMPAAWTGLADPCTFVVRIDSGVAHLYSPRTGQRRKAYAAASWKPAAFIGACDLNGLTADAPEAAAPSSFPWLSASSAEPVVKQGAAASDVK